MRTALLLARRTVLSATIALAGAAAPAGAQLLYDNGPLVTHPGAGVGGADVSSLTTPNTVIGYGHNLSAGLSVADDFTVTGGGWDVSRFRFFAYQTGSSTASTMTGLYLQLWDAQPGTAGASVVWGDMTTNRLTGTDFAGIYRVVDNDFGSVARPVMYLDAVLGSLSLAPGAYWVNWAATGSLGSGPWAPPISYANSVAATGNAMQFGTSGWVNLIDGAPKGLPFQVYGAAVASVPEPSTYLMLASGLAAIAGVARRRRGR